MAVALKINIQKQEEEKEEMNIVIPAEDTNVHQEEMKFIAF